MSLSRNLENNRIVSKPEIVSKAGMTGKGGKSFRLATRIATAFAAVLMAAGMALIGAGGMALPGWRAPSLSLSAQRKRLELTLLSIRTERSCQG